MTTDAEVLELISNLARQDRYVFTLHAKERLLQRHRNPFLTFAPPFGCGDT